MSGPTVIVLYVLPASIMDCVRYPHASGRGPKGEDTTSKFLNAKLNGVVVAAAFAKPIDLHL